jgi:hypothetical protein
MFPAEEFRGFTAPEMMHRKRLTIDDQGIGWRVSGLVESPAEEPDAEALLAHLESVGAILAEELRDLQRETMYRKRLTMHVCDCSRDARREPPWGLRLPHRH